MFGFQISQDKNEPEKEKEETEEERCENVSENKKKKLKTITLKWKKKNYDGVEIFQKDENEGDIKGNNKEWKIKKKTKKMMVKLK